MKIALVAPSGVPFVVGGAEKLWWGLAGHINRETPHELELIKLPSPEHDFAAIVASYERWSQLRLDHFDAVISTKYPAWMVAHPNHIVYLQHTLRGLYDTYPSHLPLQPPARLPAPAQRLWQLLQRPGADRARLPEIFARARELLSGDALDPAELAELTALPGPLLRALVHCLDAIALAPGAVRRHFAISRLVAGRAGYFPAGVAVQPLPHPSNLEGLRDAGTAEYLFTASRLDPPKRLDLLIDAYRRTRTALPLLIAGDGPQAAALRARAEGDPRIRFLGRLTDEQLIEHYSRAALVPFVPFQEDMGLITLEAMGSGKPVLTVEDAGGVTEFVQDGVNGRIVAPSPAALAQAIDQLAADPAALARMGQAARATAAAVTWKRTADGLLEAAAQGLAAPQAPAAAAPAAGARQRLLVLNTFGAWPPDNGGKKRLFYLYQGVAQWADVTLLTLAPHGAEPTELRYGPHYREVNVPACAAFAHAEGELTRALGGASVTDIAAALYGADTLGAYTRALQALAPQADVLVCAHMYLAPLAQRHWRGPLWYDAYNVEADMKAQVLGQPLPEAAGAAEAGAGAAPPGLRGPDAARHCVQRVAAIEGALVRAAEQVWAVSDSDRQRLAALYGRPAEAIRLAPNGTHLPADPWLDGARRAALKQRLGWGARPLAVFVASYHGPNLSALDTVAAVAAQCPAWAFAVVGSVCHHLQPAGRPRPPALAPNLYLLGLLPEGALAALLRAADVGLNPMHTGSGTNLKMLDYAGHGLLILSTPVGARGLAFEAEVHHLQAEAPDFPAALAALVPELPAPRPGMRAAARALAEQHYGWDAIARALAPGPAGAAHG